MSNLLDEGLLAPCSMNSRQLGPDRRLPAGRPRGDYALEPRCTAIVLVFQCCNKGPVPYSTGASESLLGCGPAHDARRAFLCQPAEGAWMTLGSGGMRRSSLASLARSRASDLPSQAPTVRPRPAPLPKTRGISAKAWALWN